MKIVHILNELEVPYPKSRKGSSFPKGPEEFSELVKADLGDRSGTMSPVENKPVEYIVQPGDTLWKIGRKLFKKDPSQIATENGLSDPDKIFPGQRLWIHPSPPKAVQSTEGKEMIASWYGAEHHHKITASGQRFDMYKDTLAHKTLPFGTKVRLINPENGKWAEGVVNDRGPYIKGRDMDISYALAKKLGFVKKGITKLNIEVI